MVPILDSIILDSTILKSVNISATLAGLHVLGNFLKIG